MNLIVFNLILFEIKITFCKKTAIFFLIITITKLSYLIGYQLPWF